MLKNHEALMALVAIATLALTGCVGVSDGSQGAGSTRSTVYTTSEFWGNYRKSAALEIDPAKSLDDLRARSDQIVLGQVVDAEAGPSYPVVLDDGTTDENGTTILTVKVEKVLAGPTATEVKVWISDTSRDLNNAPSEMMPAEPLVWYLRPSEEPGTMYATTRDGIIGTADDGKLTTMLTGTFGEEFIPVEIATIRELAASIAVFNKSSGD